MNNILNKIAQMERNAEEIKLESHKVELSLVSDIDALYKKGGFVLNSISDASKNLEIALKAQDEAIRKSNNANEQLKMMIARGQQWEQESVKVYSKVISTSKDLGIPKEQIGETKNLEKSIAEIGQAIGDAQRIASKF